MSTKEETLNLQLTIKFCSEGLPKKPPIFLLLQILKKYGIKIPFYTIYSNNYFIY